jgi:hypothetical protein
MFKFIIFLININIYLFKYVEDCSYIFTARNAYIF